MPELLPGCAFHLSILSEHVGTLVSKLPSTKALENLQNPYLQTMFEFEDSRAVQGSCCFPLLSFLERRASCAVAGLRGGHVQTTQGVKGMAGVLPGEALLTCLIER